MKKNLQNLLLAMVIAGVLALSSCSKDEPLPSTITGFAVSSFAPEVAIPVKFDNLSLNASYYVWDYGDGEVDSATVISPTHIYEEPGEYTVTLRAYNEDNAFTQFSSEVEVGQRYATSLQIVSIDMEDSLGNPWDEDSGPDVYWALGPVDASTAEEVIDAFMEDVNSGDPEGFNLPVGYSFDGLDYVLENRDFFISFDEVDTVDNEAEFNPMAAYFPFNPVVQGDESFITTTKFENGTGLIQIPFVDFIDYQVLIRFEIR